MFPSQVAPPTRTGLPDAQWLVGLRRYHKLRVLLGGFWRKENRPPSERLFRPYKDLPAEARDFLVKCAAAHCAVKQGLTLPYNQVLAAGGQAGVHDCAALHALRLKTLCAGVPLCGA